MDQLTIHEYITGITFGSIAATLATKLGQESWPHLVGLFIFGALTYKAITFLLLVIP